MENVCHTLVGGVLARAGLDRLSPLATTTMLVAANLPDVDLAWSYGSDVTYLAHHRGISHSVLGLAVEAPLLAGVVVLCDRLFRRRGNPDVEPARFLPLLLVAAVGLVSHVLLDFTNSYGVKPWLPFDATWYYADLVFIVDPWLWLLLGGALLLGASRRRGPNVGWGITFAVMAAAVVVSGSAGRSISAGWGPVVLWLLLLAAVWTTRVLWRDAPRAAVARAGLVALAAYWVMLAATHALAVRAIERASTGAATAVPTLMRPDRWGAFVATHDVLKTGEVRLGGGVTLDEQPRNLDDPAVAAASETCPGSIAVAFSRFLVADVETAPDGRRVVRLRDARFSALPSAASFATTTVELAPDLTPLPDPRPCPKSGGSW